MKVRLYEADEAMKAVAGVGGVTSGVPVVVSGSFRIPFASALVGEYYSYAIAGCFTLTKYVNSTSILFADGAPVYWDADNARCTTDDTKILIGTALGAAAYAATTMDVCVTPGLSSDISAHLSDTSDAHDASAISIADAGSRITATEVEAALQELAGSGRTSETIKGNATSIANHLADNSDAHAASAVSVVAIAHQTACADVQAALADLVARVYALETA